MVTKEAVQLHTPLGDEVLALRAGDHVELSGVVYTARDEAHLRMQKDGIPFDPNGMPSFCMRRCASSRAV
jgi:fumarate hydratase subunit beta